MDENNPTYDMPTTLPPGLPSPEQMGAHCCGVADCAAQIAALLPMEPGVDIEVFDREDIAGVDQGNTKGRGCGVEEFLAPLGIAHETAKALLIGAADHLNGAGVLLSLDLSPRLVLSPSTLARSVAEYAARAHYLTDQKDSPLQRAAKMYNVLHRSLAKRGPSHVGTVVMHPLLDEGLEMWKSKTKLPKVPPSSDDTALLEALHPEFARDLYSELSDYTHGHSLAIQNAFYGELHKHKHQCELSEEEAREHRADREFQEFRHALFAAECVLRAAKQALRLKASIPEALRIEINYAIEVQFMYEAQFAAYVFREADRVDEERRSAQADEY